MKTLLKWLQSKGFQIDERLTDAVNYISAKKYKGNQSEWVYIKKTYRGYECTYYIWIDKSIGHKTKSKIVKTYKEIISFLAKRIRG